MVKPISLDSIRDIQLVLLEDFETARNIWNNHGYYYSLTGGSVLGAVRHKGFIPWDDDLDVGLLRKDYEDFIVRTYKELPDYLKLYLRKKTRQYVILDTRYEIDYSQDNMDALFDGEMSVAYPTLDIQIFDNLPNSSLRRYLYCLHVMALRASVKLSDPTKLHQERWRPKWENVLISVAKRIPITGLVREEELIERYDKAMRRYVSTESKYIADFIGKYHMKDVYPRNWWVPVIEVEFEGITVPIPNGYDKYLTQIYGDYMTLPDESNRVSHIEEK